MVVATIWNWKTLFHLWGRCIIMSFPVIFFCFHHFCQGIIVLVNLENFSILFNFVCVFLLQFLNCIKKSVRSKNREFQSLGRVRWVFSKLCGPWKCGRFSWYKPALFSQLSWDSPRGGVVSGVAECSGDGVVVATVAYLTTQNLSRYKACSV